MHGLVGWLEPSSGWGRRLAPPPKIATAWKLLLPVTFRTNRTARHPRSSAVAVCGAILICAASAFGVSTETRTRVSTTLASVERRPRFQEMGHEIGPVAETQLRRFEIGGAQHGREVGLELAVVAHDRGRPRQCLRRPWSRGRQPVADRADRLGRLVGMLPYVLTGDVEEVLLDRKSVV